MSSEQTWELLIGFTENENGADRRKTKSELTTWLHAGGVDSFVEGVVEGLDIDHEGPDLVRDFYSELGGLSSPLSVYSYDQEYLTNLKDQLQVRFGKEISCCLCSMETENWMQGWKKSFRPIRTRMFYIYPPWEAAEGAGGRIPVEIDPGMAFGTGQHATTRVCLEAMGDHFSDRESLGRQSFLDVGAGSGILSLAALKAGVGHVDACDIDPNALLACRQNAKANGLQLNIRKGSLPFNPGKGAAYDFVVANILYVVLESMVPELAGHLAADGLLILSGLLKEQREPMLERAGQYGLQLKDETSLDDWLCLILSQERA